MKPQLVDYKNIFKEKNVIPQTPVKTEPKIINRQTNDIGFLFNMILILLIIIGLYLLYKRNKEKNIKRNIYNNNMKNLYNTINKYNE